MSELVVLGLLDFLLRNQEKNKHQQLLQQNLQLHKLQVLQDLVLQYFSKHGQLHKYIHFL